MSSPHFGVDFFPTILGIHDALEASFDRGAVRTWSKKAHVCQISKAVCLFGDMETTAVDVVVQRGQERFLFQLRDDPQKFGDGRSPIFGESEQKSGPSSIGLTHRNRNSIGGKDKSHFRNPQNHRLPI
jgi:hypothetical protein